VRRLFSYYENRVQFKTQLNYMHLSISNGRVGIFRLRSCSSVWIRLRSFTNLRLRLLCKLRLPSMQPKLSNGFT